jgi:2'-5' RNA ligase
VRPFPITLGSVGTLGRAPARTLVCGVSEGEQALGELARRLDRALAAAGWSAEGRPFKPHLTLGRSRRREAAAAFRAVAPALPVDGLGWWVDRLTLVESQLGSGPPVYVVRATAAFGASRDG